MDSESNRTGSMALRRKIAYSYDSERVRISGVVAILEKCEARLQPEEQIAKASSEDPVRGWVELMAEWDRLCAELTEAQTARRESEAASCEPNAALTAVETATLARVQALKERIDAFLGEAVKQRQPLKGALVMGTLLSPSSDRSVEAPSQFTWRNPFKRGN